MGNGVLMEATKITNFGAVKILGVKQFVLYFAVVLQFSLIMSFSVNLAA